MCFFSSFSIVIGGERGNRPRIYSLEQLLQEAVSSPRCTKTLFVTRKTITFWSSRSLNTFISLKHPSHPLCICPWPSSLSVALPVPSLSLFQPPLTVSQCHWGHLNLLNEYEHMGGRIFGFMCASVCECPLNPALCVGGIIPLTPGSIHVLEFKWEMTWTLHPCCCQVTDLFRGSDRQRHNSVLYEEILANDDLEWSKRVGISSYYKTYIYFMIKFFSPLVFSVAPGVFFYLDHKIVWICNSRSVWC